MIIPYQNKIFLKPIIILLIFLLYISCDRCPSYYKNVGTNVFRLHYVGNALEVYQVDFGYFPAPELINIDDEYISIPPSSLLINHGKVQVCDLDFKDSFSPKYRPYRYYSDGREFILVCAGPDMEYENLEVYEKVLNDDSSTSQSFIHTIYDPTNGVISQGNIVFTSRRLGIHIDIPTHELPYIRKK